MNQALTANSSLASHATIKRSNTAPTVKPRKRTDLIVHEMDGEALVFDKMTADTHRLNATALFVWNACDGNKYVSNIANELSIAYDVQESDAQEHVEHTIDTLVERQLVIV